MAKVSKIFGYGLILFWQKNYSIVGYQLIVANSYLTKRGVLIRFLCQILKLINRKEGSLYA